MAGLLSVYLSQLIRLGHANWALITVLVLAPAQYVGAIAQRSVARVAGTLIGGFVGIWLVGNYEQDRFFFLLFTFGYLWLCMYIYGGTFFPYSFFLCANTLAAIVSRLFWPVLPEAELRKRFVDFFSICSNFLAKPPGHGDQMLSECLTLIPIECVNWAKGLKGRHCQEAEVQKLVALTLTMRRLALRLSARADAQSPALPEGIATLIDPVVEKARESFRTTSEALMRVFRDGSTRIPVPSTRTTRESFRNALQEVRNQNLLMGQSLEAVRSYLSLAHRLDVIADDLEICHDQALSLALERYWGDYSLNIQVSDFSNRAAQQMTLQSLDNLRQQQASALSYFDANHYAG